MRRNGIRAGQVAVGYKGKLVYGAAYTVAEDGGGSSGEDTTSFLAYAATPVRSGASAAWLLAVAWRPWLSFAGEDAGIVSLWRRASASVGGVYSRAMLGVPLSRALGSSLAFALAACALPEASREAGEGASAGSGIGASTGGQGGGGGQAGAGGTGARSCDVAPCTLAENQGDPTGIAVDVEHAYWSDATRPTGFVRRVPKGGGPVYDVSGDFASPLRVALSATTAYWIEGGGTRVGRATKASLGDAAAWLTGFYGPLDLALTASHAFVLDAGNGAGSVVRAPLTGSMPDDVVPVGATVHRLAVSPSRVYWTEPGFIRSFAHDLTGFVELLTPGSPRAIAHHGAFVYWIEGNTILRAEDQLAEPLPVVTLTSEPTDLAVDASGVYWTVQATGTLGHAGHTGVDKAELGMVQEGPSAIALDDEHVYWTNKGSVPGAGTVMRVAKTAFP